MKKAAICLLAFCLAVQSPLGAVTGLAGTENVSADSSDGESSSSDTSGGSDSSGSGENAGDSGSDSGSSSDSDSGSGSDSSSGSDSGSDGNSGSDSSTDSGNGSADNGTGSEDNDTDSGDHSGDNDTDSGDNSSDTTPGTGSGDNTSGSGGTGSSDGSGETTDTPANPDEDGTGSTPEHPDTPNQDNGTDSSDPDHKDEPGHTDPEDQEQPGDSGSTESPDGSETPDQPEEPELPDTPDSSNPELPEEGNTDADSEEGRGVLNVVIYSVLTASHNPNFNIELTPIDRKNTYYGSDSSSGGHGQGETIQFKNVPTDRYLLQVTGEGYEDYEQEIFIDNNRSVITLVNSFDTVDENQKSRPGILKAGDVNGDGVLDEEDQEEILAVLTGEKEETPGSSSDVNGDGEVTILDLQMFTYFYNNPLDGVSTISTSPILQEEDITVATTNNATRIEGNAASLFTDEPSSVKLLPEEGAKQLTLEVEVKNVKEIGGMVIEQKEEDSRIKSGEIRVTAEDGSTYSAPIGKESSKRRVRRSTDNNSVRKVTAQVMEDGSININFGQQIAVKKVTFIITESTSSDMLLAEISKVEFVNDMEKRVPPPVSNAPTGLTLVPGSEEFTATWKKSANVAGYELKIEEKPEDGEKAADSQPEILSAPQNRLVVTSFNGADLVNGTTYLVSVRSVNGNWASDFSETMEVTPKAKGVPDKPEQVSITGGYLSLFVSWKAMKDTDSYTVYYRISGEETEYQSVDTKTNSITLSDLKNETTYQVYIVGHNEIGSSQPSALSAGTTASINPPVTPNYKLMNIPVEGQEATRNIESVTITHGASNTNSRFSIVDGDYATSWIHKDWDAGVSYPANGHGKGPQITFKESFEMDTVVIVPDDIQPYNYVDATIYYWDDSGKGQYAPGSFTRKTDAKGRPYYEFQTDNPIQPKTIEVNLRTYNQSRISIAELKFYFYDSLEKEIENLFIDDMHVTLESNVTEETIQKLQDRVDTPDEKSGEYHPKRELLTLELKKALDILNSHTIAPAVKIHTGITKKADGSVTFKGGLNAWQPLGITAMEGDKLIVFVGGQGKKAGETTPLNLVATQYHAESGAWATTVVKDLKAGRNEVQIPQIISSKEQEHGGALYIEYTGDKGTATKPINYSVRVDGGKQIPVLDLAGITDEAKRQEMLTAYIEALKVQLTDLEGQHEAIHGTNENSAAFNEQNCILGATDIGTDKVMYSFASRQVYEALKAAAKSEDTAAMAAVLDGSLKNMDDMVSLFYQHKGLSNEMANPETNPNRLPVSRLNIRYQRMFAGAFMYAGGQHIGIEWGSIPGLFHKNTIQYDENGAYKGGRYFGWGIAHEIGHEINEGAYAIAEITNNYFSVLAQAQNNNTSVRFQYPKVYDKVTSGAKGRSSDVFTQLGMYWQLHLAYDWGGYNYKKFDSYEEQLENLFFARVDTYARTPDAAPHPGNIRLTLGNDADTNLMRLACAAAEKNLLPFFERWGMTPDRTTRLYAEQFPEEERAIWFINDKAHAYVMEDKTGSTAKTIVPEVTMEHKPDTNQVTLNIQSGGADGPVLGYEITRSYTRKGVEYKEPVGFVMADDSGSAAFTDVISTINNRVFTYEVTGYDNYLMASRTISLEPVKISHNNVSSKGNWTLTTNMVSAKDPVLDEENPDKRPNDAIQAAADNKIDTAYIGQAEKGDVPYIIIQLDQIESLTGLVYNAGTAGEGAPVSRYNIYVSADGSGWTPVKSGTFHLDESGSERIWFNQEESGRLYTYDGAYLKLEAPGQAGQKLRIAELDIMGNTGDNIELLSNGIGRLAQDFTSGDTVIPKGSIVFTGTYKGNPSYNVVMLFDENGQIVAATNENGQKEASQLILAKVPEHGELGETSDGSWIYYIEPELAENYHLPEKVRAELYRVDEANTNKGERLVSDTILISVPETLPSITLTGQSGTP